MNWFEHFKSKLVEIYGRLELRQKLILAALALVTISLFVWLISWSTRTEYAYLIGNLDDKQAASVRDKLTELNVPYRMGEGGSAFMVPREDVYDTRLTLAADEIGITQDTGFEIFDKTSLGMTEKIQDINWIRAMQGELQRTIVNIKGVNAARVHLVLPSEKIFKEDEVPATASVWVDLKGGSLSDRKVQGIVNLIAGAVEGLDSRYVTIVDQDGNTLTEEFDDTLTGVAQKRNKVQLQVEKTLERKVKAMLDNLYGVGNSDVRITAELNFDNIETTSEQFNPDSKVSRSEEVQSSTIENEADSLNQGDEHLITNYEIDKTVSHIIKQTGDIARLTAAVNINYKPQINTENGKPVTTWVARSATELAQIETSVRNAIGFNSQRGDEVVVNNVEFDTTQRDLVQQAEEARIKRRELFQQVEKGVVLLVLVIMIMVLYRQMRRVFTTPEEEEARIRAALAEGDVDTEGFYSEGEEGMPMGEGKISYTFKPMKDIEIEQTAAQQLQEAVRNFVIENPELAVRLIKSWLLESKGL